MKKAFFAILALFGMLSCDTQIVEEPVVGTGYGYINLCIGADTEMVMTRATTTPSAEDLNKYGIVITKNGVTDPVYTGTYAGLTDGKLKVEAGTYTVVATNLTEEEAYYDEDGATRGCVRVSGSNDNVVVTAGVTSNCNIECNPINSKVSFRYTQNFADVFSVDASSVTVTDNDRPFSLVMKKESTDPIEDEDVAYYEAGKTLTWNLIASLSGTTKQYSNTFTTQADKWSVVTFNVSSTAGNINIIISINDQITEIIPVPVEIDPLEGSIVGQV